MAPSRIQKNQYRAAETTIGIGSMFVGVLTSDGNVQIDGVFEGELTSALHVLVNNSGRVRAQMQVTACTINGSVIGNINASSDVVVESTARIWGEIDAATLQIQPGAVFKGSSHGKD